MLLICTKANGQNIFILEKPGLKFYNYYEANSIKIETSNESVKGVITMISDSSIFINGYGEVLIRNISKVYTKRWGYNLMQGVFLGAGIFYLVISTINGALNNGQDMPGAETIGIGGGLIIAGIALTPLTSRKHKIYPIGNWKVKILDLTDNPVWGQKN